MIVCGGLNDCVFHYTRCLHGVYMYTNAYALEVLVRMAGVLLCVMHNVLVCVAFDIPSCGLLFFVKYH